MKAGADINVVYYNETLLEISIEKSNTELFWGLINAGADVNFVNSIGDTMPMMAYTKGLLRELEYLIDNVEDLDVKDKHGKTLFHIVVDNDDIITAKKLYKADAELDIPDNSGKTLLMKACEKNDVELFNMIAFYSDCLAEDNNGKTAFMYACEHSCLEIIKNRVWKDLCMRVWDNKGKSAMDYALDRDDYEIIGYVYKHFGDDKLD